MEKLVKNTWGNGAKLTSWSSKEDDGKGSQWASQLKMGTATVEIPVIIKVQPVAARRALLRSDAAFHNECLMYKSILPAIEAEEFAPRMYWGKATLGQEPEEDTIVLELLEGYKPCKDIFFDEAHLMAAVVALAKFHSCGYKNKSKISLYTDELANMRLGESAELCNLMVLGWTRGIAPLLHKYSALRKLKEIIDTDLQKVIQFLEDGEEPTKVLCHGDFCGNNMLFNDNLEVKFLDFQRAMYSSPVVDLTFILTLNTSAEVRASSWDKLINAYLDNLTDAPPREVMLQEINRRAMYGYIHTSFFLADMVNERSESPVDCEWLFTESLEEATRKKAELGGEEVTQLLVSLVEFLTQKGYVQNLIDSLN